MRYPNFWNAQELARQLEYWCQLMQEYGSGRTDAIRAAAEKALARLVRETRRLPIDKAMAEEEPNSLAKIRALRPRGPRVMWREFDEAAYRDRVEGALLARMAGCTLGAPIEGSSVVNMEYLAAEQGMAYPPTDYWKVVPHPYYKRYDLSCCREYTCDGIDGVPVDDDIAYTLLGLLVVEDFGPAFTVEDVGKAWLKYLPYACTAEHIALNNLKKKVSAARAAVADNPFVQWIGADIRSDPWGYMAPGLPQQAAEMAWRDAYISHRRNGIYGEMYFSAVIAAAFALDDPMRALEIGLTEIPRRCATARGVRWALAQAPKIRDYKQGRAAVDRKFAGMNSVHTINNACLTIFGLAIGGRDVTKVIGHTVAMGLDNDCTAATAGSIVGAVVGRRKVPKQWTRNFNNTVHSYLIGRPKFSIDGLVDRFTRQARKVFAHRGKRACP